MAVPKLAMIPSGYKAGKLYSILPTDGTGDFTVARNSTATRINSAGLIETVGVNVPRLDYPTIGGCPELLCETQSTNLYLNSAVLVTQNITTTATSYTVSFYGTGTVTFSGSYVGSLVGTGSNNRVKLTFTATDGTLVSTVSGTVTNAQAENLSYSTSYIATVGTTVTRLADVITGQTNASNFNSSEGTLMVEMRALSDNLTDRIVSLSNGTNENRLLIYYSSPLNTVKVLFQNSLSYITISTIISDAKLLNKFAISYKQNSLKLFVNGVNKASNNSLLINTTIFDRIILANATGSAPFYGKLKQLKYYPTALSDAELITLTT